MSNEIIKKYLEKLKMQNRFDKDFVSILYDSNELNEEGQETASKVLGLIKKRYDKNKEDKT